MKPYNSQTGPALFFYVNGELLFHGCSIDDGEPYGDFVNYPHSHYDIWNENYAQKYGVDFDYYPRGRVVYRKTDDTYLDMKSAGISKFCGSVIKKNTDDFSAIKSCNRDALKLRKLYKGDYIPGFQVSPNFIDESIMEIDYAHQCGINLIGELVPYMHNWSDYSCKEFSLLLEHIEKYDMTVNLHTLDLNQMEIMAKNHPHINFVFAHPGEKTQVLNHIDIMKRLDNVFLDISGTGIIRYGVIKKLVSEVGAERILFGTDYPIGNLQVYINGVLGEKISDYEKEQIFCYNAKKLLKKGV